MQPKAKMVGPASNGTWAGPRERLAAVGASALSPEELVAILLGTGSRNQHVMALAARVIQCIGGVAGLSQSRVGELAEVPGMGVTKASRLVAAIELGRRAFEMPLRADGPIRSSAEVAAALGPRLVHEDVEQLIAILLDARSRPRSETVIARGGMAACPVHPADAFRAAIREAASGIVFVHNHPSGDPSPSPEDIDLTERFVQAGALLGIRVLDHVIVARTGHFSFLDAGLLGGGKR